MTLITRVKIIIERVADWLDDRWTWTAIGLLTGYFGFGSSDALEWQAWQEAGIALASLALILIRDKKRRPDRDAPAGWNDAGLAPETTTDATDADAKPVERTAKAPVVDRRVSAVPGRLRYPVPPEYRPNPVEQAPPVDRPGPGFNDRDSL